MRDILNLLDKLAEANLGAPEIPAGKLSNVPNPATGRPYSRPELFLYKVQNNSPFTTLKGEQITVDPQEAQRVASWISSGAKGPAGSITLRTTDGGQVKNTELLKTVEFGSKEAENIKIKGSDVFDTKDIDIEDFGNSMDEVLAAGGFPANEMYSKLESNANMKKLGKLGDAVIYMAWQADQAQVPVIPDDLSKYEVKAIELYASEYLGALGLVTGGVPFIRGSREEFEEFVGGSLGDMIMYFPKDTSNPLADSFTVVNNKSGHAVKLSSKAAGKGAAPSLGSMKIPEDVRKKYPEAADFIDLAQDKSIGTFEQPFELMNYINVVAGDKIPRDYRSIVPFSPETIAAARASMDSGRPMPRRLMSVFEKRLSQKLLDAPYTDGGKAWWATIQDMMRIVNDEGAVPKFREALIESLGYNFVQLYTNVKGDILATEAFWPAKISGQVKLKTKGSAGEMKGKMSVEISPGKDDYETPGGKVNDRPAKTKTADLDVVGQRRSSVKANQEPEKLGTEKTLGRKRQR